MQRHIKLMWDYHCWPLWETEAEHYALEPDSLPLSETTKHQLLRWASIPDAKLAEHLDYPGDITWTMAETRIFEAEGEALREIVQCELGAGFHLTYHGEGG
jgi:hypothetical protein